VNLRINDHHEGYLPFEFEACVPVAGGSGSRTSASWILASIPIPSRLQLVNTGDPLFARLDKAPRVVESDVMVAAGDFSHLHLRCMCPHLRDNLR